MNSPELKVTKVVDTRWLSHTSISSSTLSYSSKDPTAIGLFKCMAKYTFFASLLLLDDVWSSVNRLSLAFQRTRIDLTTVSPLLISAIKNLEKKKKESASDFKRRVKQLIHKTVQDGIALQQSETESEPEESPTSEDENEPHEVLVITVADRVPEKYESNVQQKFLSRVITNLGERFPKVNILETFSVLLGESVAEEHLVTLLDHYEEDGPMEINKIVCID